MKNKLIDLNDHLFAQLERLSDEDISGDVLKEEINRAKSITSVANAIVSNGTLALQAQKALGDNLVKHIPAMLEHKHAI
ncbi:MAG: hypothetical protein COA86_02640 [Kangiella sp.]|nr:MAG: hypothetical protein COA86_02640 [Kangiella sp.]